MLSELLKCPADVAAMGARRHALHARGQAELFGQCFRRDDWTCRQCGFRFRGFMEIDHPGSHMDADLGSIRTICQFCHNLRHPVWADLKGRLRMIWAPSLTQDAIHRIAWLTLLASEDPSGFSIDGELAEAAREIVAATKRRERLIADVIGSSNPGGLFEAIFTVKPYCRRNRHLAAVASIDNLARFWPVAADRIVSPAPRPCAALSRWVRDRFEDISAEAVSEYWRREQSIEGLRRLCADHQKEMEV